MTLLVQPRRLIVPRGYVSATGGGGGGGDGGGTSPSGVDMPTSAPAGWTRYWAQDFNTDCTGTNFAAVYYGSGTFNAAAAAAGGGLVGSYDNSVDTRGKNVASTVDGRAGRYFTKNLSVSGGVLRMHMWWDPTNNWMSVCAPIPKLSASGRGYIGTSRRSIRARVVIGTTRATTKVAWLSWPQSDHSTTLATAGVPDASTTTGFRGGDGEWDFPEQDTGSTVHAYNHKQNALRADTASTPIFGNYQQQFDSTTDFFGGAWHTYTDERVAGSYNSATSSWVGQSGKFFVDGVQLTPGTITSRVPMTPMKWVWQSETTLSYSTALNTTVDYYIEVDWATVDI